MKYRLALVAVAWAVAIGVAHAEDPPASSLGAAPATETTPVLALAMLTVPAGSMVNLEIADPVSSKTNVRGDKVALKLASPIMADGHVLVPAGTRGVGEVIDASPAGMMGKSGELLLAARYLDYDGRQIPLKAFKLGGQGTDNTGAALAVMVAVGLPGVLVRGGNMQIQPGTAASAKLAADITLPISSDAAQTPAQPEAVQPSPTTQHETQQ